MIYVSGSKKKPKVLHCAVCLLCLHNFGRGSSRRTFFVWKLELPKRQHTDDMRLLMWKTSPERRHVAGGDLFDLGQYPHGDAYPDCDGKGGPQQLGFEYTCIASYPFKETGVMSRFISFYIFEYLKDIVMWNSLKDGGYTHKKYSRVVVLQTSLAKERI